MNAPIFRQPSQRHTPQEKAYYAWMHDRCTCCLTGSPEFHIAHTDGLAQGTGMAQKASLSTCLPLVHLLHLEEEKGRERFWQNAGIPDYLAWAERLYDLFETNQRPDDLLLDMQDRANRDYLLQILVAHQR